MADERERAWGWKGEVARELGIHESLVGKLETGERTGVSLDTVEKIAKRSARYRGKLKEDPPAPEQPAERAEQQVTETRSPRRDAADAGHWLKLTLDAWKFEGARREGVIKMLEDAAPPLQPQTVRTLVDMWLRLESLESRKAPAAKPDAPSPAAGKHGEARGGRRLAGAKPAKRLK